MSSRSPLRVGLAALALGMFLVGCGADKVETADDTSSTTSGSTTSTTPKPTSLPADQVVWQVNSGGGFVPQEAAEQEVPQITIYGDGRVFVSIQDEGDSYDDPARFETATVDGEALATFLGHAESSGLFGTDPVDMGSPGVTDMPTTTVTMQAAGPPRTVSAYAFSDGFEDGLTKAQVENREKLSGLIDDAADLVGQTEPWTPEQVRVKSWEPGDTSQPGASDEWPGPGLEAFPEPTDQIPSPCLVVDGEMAETVYEAAREHEGSVWKIDDVFRTLTVTPLLPGQEGCPEM